MKEKKIRNKTQISSTSFIDENSIIGNYTYIGERCKITKATIGRYVSMGDNVTIGPGEHNLSKVSTSHHFFYGESWYDYLTQQDCIIGNDVWIGVNSVIKRGVKVGNGAVIGANSFVNKDVPDFAVVGGYPAKIIKYRFDEEIQKRITESKWWDKDLDEARMIVNKLDEDLISINDIKEN